MSIRLTYKVNDKLICEKNLHFKKYSDLIRLVYRLNENENIKIVNYICF